MDHFKVSYIPGGMGLNHSGWWLTQRMIWSDGTYYDHRIKFLRRANYQ